MTRHLMDKQSHDLCVLEQKYRKHAAAAAANDEQADEAAFAKVVHAQLLQVRFVLPFTFYSHFTRQKLEAVFNMTTRNCQVNGSDWDRLGMEVRQTMEPLDEKLESRLLDHQQHVEHLVMKLVQLRQHVPQRLELYSQKQAKRRLDAMQSQTQGQDQPLPVPEPVVYKRAKSSQAVELKAVVDRLQETNALVAPLLSKLDRYQQFAADELGRYDEHCDRLKASLDDKEGGFMDRLNEKMALEAQSSSVFLQTL